MAQLLKTSFLVAAGLTSVANGVAVNSPRQDTTVITDDTFFYGQSPPVYPSPQMPNGTSWAAAHAKATALVSQMTLEERANITVGHSTTTGCSGVTGSVPRLGWSEICLSDAGNGLRNTDFVNGWASGIHVGAAWNRDLTFRRALQMGGEFKKKGVNVALGPVVGPLGRIPEGGRDWEGFSNDPYLGGQLVSQHVTGIQQAGIIPTVKHYIGNEQETNRNPTTNTTTNMTVASVSSNIDDQTMHELYLWPFADAVHAGAAAVMCSYNRLNNSYACQNSKTLNGLLKTELGFEGFVVSDWDAQHSGLASAEAGLDLVMPNSPDFWGPNGENLTAAVNNGSLAEDRVTDMATRIIAAWYQLGQDEGFPEAGIGMPSDFTKPHTAIYARDPASKDILLNAALEGHVLVKNENKTLPLSAPRSLAIFGYDAPAPPALDVGSPTSPFSDFALGYESALNVSFGGEFNPQIAQNGTFFCGGGSGAVSPAYISAPFDALQEQAYQDGTTLFWDFTSGNPIVDADVDACLVFINAFSTEGNDRAGLHDDFSDALVTNVANNCTNTIVVIHNAGVRLVDQWIEHPNVKAVIFAHLPGQDSGRSVVQLLYGVQSPSGKLPYTVAKNESDYNTHVDLPEGEFALFPQSNFTEGVFIDYRGFAKRNITPRYEFGFGLTYTTFEYSNLTVSATQGLSPLAGGPVIEGGLSELWDVVAQASATITNTGDVEAAEIAQLYIGGALRGFDKVSVPVGGQATVHFDLLRRDLSTWDITQQAWVLNSGTVEVSVGASSLNLPLTASFTI